MKLGTIWRREGVLSSMSTMCITIRLNLLLFLSRNTRGILVMRRYSIWRNTIFIFGNISLWWLTTAKTWQNIFKRKFSFTNNTRYLCRNRNWSNLSFPSECGGWTEKHQHTYLHWKTLSSFKLLSILSLKDWLSGNCSMLIRREIMTLSCLLVFFMIMCNLFKKNQRNFLFQGIGNTISSGRLVKNLKRCWRKIQILFLIRFSLLSMLITNLLSRINWQWKNTENIKRKDVRRKMKKWFKPVKR